MTRACLRADKPLKQIIYKDFDIRANVIENPCSYFCPSQCQCQILSEILGFKFNDGARFNLSSSILNIIDGVAFSNIFVTYFCFLKLFGI